MTEIARVVSLIDNKAKVEIKDSSGCGGGCGGCKGCSAAVSKLIEVDNTIGVRAGQDVEIERKAEGYYKALLLVYGLPLVMLIVGIVFGIEVGGVLNAGASKELIGAALGIGAWIGSHYLAGIVDKKYNLSNRVKYIIKAVL